MMTVDLTAFSEEKFDSKRWINAACASRDPQDPADKHLADLEMRLQLLSEEIAASLDEQSQASLLRVPRSIRDVVRLRDDASSLRSAVLLILQRLNKAEGSSAESIAALAEIDTIKQRMEAANETLQDAAGLTQLSASVDDVFASGDLPRAAEILANMRHCLSAVGEVAEFANVRKQVEVLEDRLDAMVQPRLSDGISNRKVDEVQSFREILILIGRLKSVELIYTKIRIKSIRKLWEDFESKQVSNKLSYAQDGERRGDASDLLSNPSLFMFASWLPNFYDDVLLYLEQEWKWCMTAFPDDFKVLVPKLLVETMAALNTSFSSHINVATGEVVPETRALEKGILDILSGDVSKGAKLLHTKHLEALIELHNMTSAFAKNIQHLFAGSDSHVLAQSLKAIYSPYEPYKQKYGQMERAILSSELAMLDLRGAVARGVGAQGIELSETVRRMEESIPQVIVILEAAVERCISFTGGSEAGELVRTIDETMLQYLSSLQDALKSLRTVCGLDNVAWKDGQKKDAGLDKKDLTGSRLMDVVSDEEEWAIVQGALQILTVADCLSSRLSVFGASLRATLLRLGTNISLSAFGLSDQHQHSVNNLCDNTESHGKNTLDITVLRLTDVPEKAKKLSSLLEQSKDPRFHALPLASQRVAAFSDLVNELVYEVLISKVRQRLSNVAQMSIWSSAEEQSGFPIPSFNAYPQAYVTSVGEYLLTLPQQLEPLGGTMSSGESNNDEAQFFAAEWMFKVAEGATALYIEQLRSIQSITDQGAQQLATDIEYLSNVLSALSMPIPTILYTFQTCLSTPADQLPELVKSDAGSQLDLPAARLVCRIRRVNLEQ